MAVSIEPTVVIGAGLAGLACAIHLHEAGRPVVVLEAGDGVGGRVRTDIVDGFVLDRGFQVLLTAYPEAQRMLDYDALDLRAYKAGALVQIDGQRHVVADPFRNPMSLLATFKAPIGSLIDKARIAWLRRDVLGPSIDALWSRPETTTGERLRAAKFSDEIIDRFFRPLFAGIQLDPSLLTSSRMFDFVFRMLSSGDSAVPARGMQAIPDQLAARLPADTIRLRSAVASVADGVVTLTDGSVVLSANVVVATDGVAAAALVGSAGLSAPGSNSVTCLYFASETAPFEERMILLNGEGSADGPVNNVCVPSLLSGTVAPAGAHLVSASVVGSAASLNDVELLDAARLQLRGWFGAAVDGWSHLRTYRIDHAQPAQVPPALSPVQRPVKLGDGLYVCGDHRDTASIHGALLSGRRAADAIVTASV